MKPIWWAEGKDNDDEDGELFAIFIVDQFNTLFSL